MELTAYEATEVEVVLENNVERDAIRGVFRGWEQVNGVYYMVMEMSGVCLSYIKQSAIRAMHFYGMSTPAEGPRG